MSALCGDGSIRSSDFRLILAATFLRSSATGLVGIVLGAYLAQLQLPPATVGLIIAAGLTGGAFAATFLTFAGGKNSRRASLIVLSALSALGGLAATTFTQPIVLSVVAFFGMLNGMGRDRGAALILEQAILPAITSDERRTRTFAWYNVLQDSGHAVGGLITTLPALILGVALGGSGVDSRFMLLVYAAMMAAVTLIYFGLSPAVESGGGVSPRVVSTHTKRIVGKISALFFVDSLGGGFLTTALLSWFFFKRFGVGIESVGLLFFGARVLNAISHLGAAWLARRIGLVNTMVFTHIPSSLLLVTVAIAPNFLIAAMLFLLREGLVEMDVPTRQSYVMAVVAPEERVFASGMTNLVRLGGWAIGPLVAGALTQGVALMAPLVAGAGMKICYDITLYFSFRHIKPPEEHRNNARS